MRFGFLFVSVAAVVALGACGGNSENDSAMDPAKANKISQGTCPAVQKGNGIAVGSRIDYDDLLDSNTWRDEMFSESCAGGLAAFVPSLPEGFGVIPTVQPYIMNDNQVYLAYGEIPDPRIDAMSGQPNIPSNMDRIDIEIRRFTPDELEAAKTWLSANPDEFFSAEINGQTAYLVNGMGFGRVGKGDKLLTALQIFRDDGVVLRVNHRSLYNQTGGVNISPLVERIMVDMLTPD